MVTRISGLATAITVKRLMKMYRPIYKQVQGYLLLIFILSLSIFVTPVHAKKAVHKPPHAFEKVTFMVAPQLPPDNIGGQHLGYFNLPVKPHQQLDLAVKVINPTNQAIHIKSKAYNATTNDNGSLDYQGTHPDDPQLLKQPGTTFIALPKKITLPAQATQLVHFKVAVPKRGFIGQKAIGLNLIADQPAGKAAVKNRYVYIIGLVLNGQKLKPPHQKGLSADNIQVRLVSPKKEPAISVQLANHDPAYILNGRLAMALVNQKYHFFNYRVIRKHVKIAPNSRFDNNLLLGGKRLVPGIYQLKVKIDSHNNHHTFNKTVKITKTQARFINRHNYRYLVLQYCLMAGLSGLLLLITCLIYFKKTRLKDAKIN